MTYQKILSKNNLHLLVKLSTENSYFRVSIFYFLELQLLIQNFFFPIQKIHSLFKISEEINWGITCS